LKTLIVIPARLASSRLPEKMLLDRTGIPLIQHTWQQAKNSRLASDIVVATDHARIQAAVTAFGGQAIMTDPSHQSGSERCCEVAAAFPDFDLYCNVQGDEPEIEPGAIDKAIQVLIDGIADQQAPVMATLATPIRSQARLHDPSCVKVTIDQKRRALYFSRSLIPFPRDFVPAMLEAQPPLFFQHIGLYVYTRNFILNWSSLPVSRWEDTEKLEQLRVLDAGHEIMVDIVPSATSGIDTIEDYQAFVSRQAN